MSIEEKDWTLVPTKDWSSHNLVEAVKEAVKDDSRATEYMLEIEKRLRVFHDAIDKGTNSFEEKTFE